MTITATAVAPRHALRTLGDTIARAKGDDPLTPVTVAVPTNTCGVMTRRALGRRGGIVGVDMVTLNRLAELIAGPQLAAADRSPMSTPVVDLAIASVLRAEPGPFRAVAAHPSTIVALRELHQELRLAGGDARRRLAEQSVRGRQAIGVSEAVTDTLRSAWYDEADLLTVATDLVRAQPPDGLRHLMIHLPQELRGLSREFVRALGAGVDVQIIVQITGDPAADADVRELLEALDIDAVAPVESATTPVATVGSDTPAGTAPPATIISTTDADDEVRLAARHVLHAARAGTPLERIAVLWPSHRPYARLVEHHLTAAEIPWNGRAGTALAERLAPRLVLDLLDVDRRGLRRRHLFDLLADVPARGDDGHRLPTAAWERVSREAGVSRGDDWTPRLSALAGSDRWGETAASLRTFVDGLRHDLGRPSQLRQWSDWAQWCADQLDRWLGRYQLERLPEPEYRAWEALTRALDRLRHLDPVDGPVSRHSFRATLEAELDAAPTRQGRVGDGVTIGPLAGAVGLDVDVVVILGAAEGLLPPTPVSHPLLSEADRTLAGLATADARTTRLRRLFVATLDTATVTLTVPRGDLRATATIDPSRWIEPWSNDPRVAHQTIHSHQSGLATTEFPVNATEHRLRSLYGHVLAGLALSEAAAAANDITLMRGLDLVIARHRDELTVYDGDLSEADLPRLDGAVSPSRLEAWMACPHGYFMRYLLGVRPVDEPDDEISITALDRGSAHHAALDRFHRAVIDGDLAQPGPGGWTAEHRAALGAFFDEVTDRTERRGRTGRPAFWADERSRMRADLLSWLDNDSAVVAQRGSTVLDSELRFGPGDGVTIELSDGRGIQLTGSIDRVDRTGDGSLVVTDHKTGSKRKYRGLSADDPTLGGQLFQLPSYAAAARSRYGDDRTTVIAEYGLMGRGGYERIGFPVTPEVTAQVREHLDAIVTAIETGYFPNRPERPGWRLWVPCEYCEPDHLGTAPRWAEWERKMHDPRLHRWFGQPHTGETTP